MDMQHCTIWEHMYVINTNCCKTFASCIGKPLQGNMQAPGQLTTDGSCALTGRNKDVNRYTSTDYLHMLAWCTTLHCKVLKILQQRVVRTNETSGYFESVFTDL